MYYLSLIPLLGLLAPSEAQQGQYQAPSSYNQTRPMPSPSGGECSFWLEDIKHQGVAAFNDNPSGYQVFRNVRDFGATGDGQTDDTAAINRAISSGDRCSPSGCDSTTTTPAVVYFPAGTYMISSSIVNYYYTQFVGNPNCLPTIRATATFSGGLGLIDGDQYGANGLGWGATTVFWQSIRNFILDMTLIPASTQATGIHWPVGQANNIQNVVFEMSQADGTQHQGIFIEEGSGGFMGDLTFNGGLRGLYVGNQQFTMRNMTFNNCVTAIQQIWDWGWTYYGLSINNCEYGLDISGGGPDALSVGSITFFDSTITDTPVGIRTGFTNDSRPSPGNSLILENIDLSNVPVAVQDGNKATILQGTPVNTRIDAWGQGHRYTPNGPTRFQGSIPAFQRPANLVQADGRYYARSRPQYAQEPLSAFISARDLGATGDGRTDDTQALQEAINVAFARRQILYLDHGDYLVTQTIYVPRGVRMVGEAFSVILSSGENFNDIDNPRPVVQLGKPGEIGSIEMSDIVVSTQGQQRGAILFEFNLASPADDPSGLWDTHARIGGFAGSELGIAECPKTPDDTITAVNLGEDCIGSFLTLHMTKLSSGLYAENVWLWLGDHDLEAPGLPQITVYAGRGLLAESRAGPLWLVGTGVEHHVKYNYQFVNTRDVFAGQIQTESAYFQPNPNAQLPFPYVAELNDPDFPDPTSRQVADVTLPSANGWGLRIIDSTGIGIYGAGLYSFFNNYSTDCSAEDNGEAECQDRIFELVGAGDLSLYNLNTVGTYFPITVNGEDVSRAQDNKNGFVDSIALFRPG